MTSELTQLRPQRKRIPGAGSILTARLVLFWEKLWPALLPALGVLFLYAFISLLDLWRFAPVWLHAALLAAGGAALAVFLYRRLRPLRFPGRRAGQARLERDGRVAHAALQALDDAPFAADAAASPLWRAHLEASAERAKAARLKAPAPQLETADPIGLRFIALGLFVIALIVGGEDSLSRLATGLRPGAAGTGGGPVADLWIEPPAYTGRAPVYLLRAGAPVNADRQIDAPEGSVVVAQINGAGRARLAFQTPEASERADFTASGAARRAELPLAASGLLRLSWGGRDARWPIGVIADDDPKVWFTAKPEAGEDGRLAVSLAIEDDFGVASATLIMQLDPDQPRPLDAPAIDAAALEERRRVALDGVTGKRGERALALDLQADPWAGMNVRVKVVVTDGAGQTGESDRFTVTLPTRKFYNPSARAVIEQRQTLAVAPSDWRRAARSFDAMTLAPDVFYAEKPTDYLMLRAAFWRVMRQDGEGYGEAVEKFWPLALQLEDEALELARQRLEAAREALRQALESGAGDDEIARRIEELRQAMNDYLAALAQSGAANAEAPPQNAQQIERSDLDDMLDAIRNLSEQGADGAARQMLSELENMLNNLRLSGSGSGQGQSQGAGQGAGGEGAGGPSGAAGDLIGRQRELADETFARGRAGDGNGADLAAREGALGGALDSLLDQLSREAPGSEALRALGMARNAMREAEGALSGDDFAAAADAMERAIGALREGAGALAEQQRREARENGEGGGESGRGLDPLGRPAGAVAGSGVDVPGETDAGRTRAVIDELRRRLGEPGREDEEKDYLERLLERF